MFSRKRAYPFENEHQHFAHDALNGENWRRSHALNQDFSTGFNNYLPDFESTNFFSSTIDHDVNSQQFSTIPEPWQTNQLPTNELPENGVDGTACANEEGHVCFGSVWPPGLGSATAMRSYTSQIPDVKAQLRLQPPARYDATFAPSQCFDILEHGAFYALESLGEKFAVLNKKVCQDIQILRRDRDMRMQAFVPREQWLQSIQQWESERASAVVNFDLNIYGPRRHAAEVGRILSSTKLFLQRPIHGTSGLLYYNPHYLHIDEVLGNEVLETPLYFAQDRSHKARVDVFEQAEKSPDEETHQLNDTTEIDTILNSLSHHSILAKSVADRRIRSNLLEYVLPRFRMFGYSR
jgi:hypothetical protein